MQRALASFLMNSDMLLSTRTTSSSKEGSPAAVHHAADGVAQFFDRDAPAEMAKVAMDGFQKFMVKPDQIDRHS